jgi:protein-disulfide isomerase
MMNRGNRFWLIFAALVVLGGAILAGQAQKQANPAAGARETGVASGGAGKASTAPAAKRTAGMAGLSEDALRNKILQYVRERFGVPLNVTLTAGALTPSVHPGFLQTTIVSDNGKEKHNNNAYVTRDQKLLVIGSVVPVKSDPKSEVIANLRTQFKIPATSNVTATDFRPSSFPDLLATTVTVHDGKEHPQVQEFYMTKDGTALVVGSLFAMTVDPRQLALRTISTANQPSLGSAAAPITIVEYSDLQCPMCGRMHDFLENDVLKKYAGKVRVVFKEFPIASIHDWTLTASIANQCAYQISPPSYVPYRTMIFKNQSSTNATNVRELMISYGEQLGLDRLRLAACIDSKASLARVEANFREGQAVGVQSTPTTFINGKVIVGMPAVDTFYKSLDEALAARKPGSAATSARRSQPSNTAK